MELTLSIFQTLETVEAAKAFIEDNKIAVIGFFKVGTRTYLPYIKGSC